MGGFWQGNSFGRTRELRVEFEVATSWLRCSWCFTGVWVSLMSLRHLIPFTFLHSRSFGFPIFFGAFPFSLLSLSLPRFRATASRCGPHLRLGFLTWPRFVFLFSHSNKIHIANNFVGGDYLSACDNFSQNQVRALITIYFVLSLFCMQNSTRFCPSFFTSFFAKTQYFEGIFLLNQCLDIPLGCSFFFYL